MAGLFPEFSADKSLLGGFLAEVAGAPVVFSPNQWLEKTPAPAAKARPPRERDDLESRPPRPSQGLHHFHLGLHLLRGLIPVFRGLLGRANNDPVNPNVATNPPRWFVKTSPGHFAAEHFIEHHPDAEDVRPVIDIHPVRLLRRHVIRRAHHHAGHGAAKISRAGVKQPRQSEIGNLHAVPRIDHHVSRFDIPVDDLFAVGVSERRAPARRHPAPVRNRGRQGGPGHPGG